MKKAFATIVCLFMVFTSWALQQKIDGINYNLIESTKEAKVIKSVNKYSGAIVIPPTVSYNGITYKVTNISTEAFYECTNLTSVVLPSSLTHINEFAFSGCTGLKSVNIPNSVLNIESRAFEYCTELTFISIPQSVTSIGDGAFAGCRSLASITVDEDNTSYVSEDNFVYSKARTQLVYCITSKKGDVVIPNSVLSIRDYAFEGCVGLSSISIPISVSDIGSGAFFDCKGLTSINIPNGLTKIKHGTFSRCTNLSSITIPSSVTSIEDQAFLECDALNMVTCLAIQVPSAAKNTFSWTSTMNATLNVPAVAFESYLSTSPWSGFTTIEVLPCEHILSSVDNGDGTHSTSCANCDFSETVGHTFVNGICIICNIEENPDPIAELEVDGIIYELVKKAKVASVKGVIDRKNLAAADIPASLTYKGSEYTLTRIGDFAFDQCSKLETLILPSTITRFGQFSFQSCSALTSLTLPNSLEVIENSAFNGCIGLTEINIPESVTTIENGAFFQCRNLRKVTFGKTYRGNLSDLFPSCENLVLIEIDNANSEYASIDGVVFSKDKTSLIYFPPGRQDEYEIPNNVIKIATSAFSGCSRITSVIIPNTVTTIGGSAFFDCYNLENVSMGNSVSTIEDFAFGYCGKLSSFELPNSVIQIGSYAFYHCYNLTSIIIPNSVTVINCNTFEDCSGLQSVNLDDAITAIYSEAFAGCSKLTTLIIPNAVEVIGDNSFNGCTSLINVTLGSSVSSIGDNAFAKCPSLETVYCHAEIVPETVSNAFAESYIEYCTLYVPDASAVAYKASAPWSEFGTIQTTTGDDIPILEPCATPIITFVDGKIVCVSETEGAECYYSMSPSVYTDSEENVVVELRVTAYAVADDYMKSEDAVKTFTIRPSDVNLDGEVNIGDVTTLVNKILQKDVSK